MKLGDIEKLTKINPSELIGKTINIPGATYSNNYHIPIKIEEITMIYNRPLYLINHKYIIYTNEYFKIINGEWLVEIGKPEFPFRDSDNREILFPKDKKEK